MARRTCLLTLAFCTAWISTAAPKAVVGDPPPEFSVATVDGKHVSISDLRGKRVVVFMWASW